MMNDQVSTFFLPSPMSSRRKRKKNAEFVCSNTELVVELQPNDEAAIYQGRVATNVAILMSVIAAPSAALLRVAVVVAAKSLVAAVLAILMALSTRLVPCSSTEASILASLATM